MKMRNLFYTFVIFGQVVFMPGLATAEEPNSGPPKGEVSPKADMPGQKEKEKAMTVKLQWFGHRDARACQPQSLRPFFRTRY
ncbi:MAG: hypothetical protein ABSH16_11875 [Sedimentisphaerales bacterium]